MKNLTEYSDKMRSFLKTNRLLLRISSKHIIHARKFSVDGGEWKQRTHGKGAEYAVRRGDGESLSIWGTSIYLLGGLQRVGPQGQGTGSCAECHAAEARSGSGWKLDRDTGGQGRGDTCAVTPVELGNGSSRLLGSVGVACVREGLLKRRGSQTGHQRDCRVRAGGLYWGLRREAFFCRDCVFWLK